MKRRNFILSAVASCAAALIPFRKAKASRAKPPMEFLTYETTCGPHDVRIRVSRNTLDDTWRTHISNAEDSWWELKLTTSGGVRKYGYDFEGKNDRSLVYLILEKDGVLSILGCSYRKGPSEMLINGPLKLKPKSRVVTDNYFSIPRSSLKRTSGPFRVVGLE